MAIVDQGAMRILMDTELFEVVKSIRNRCEILLMLSVAYPIEQIRNVLPTILEDIYADSQSLVVGHCIEEHKP